MAVAKSLGIVSIAALAVLGAFAVRAFLFENGLVELGQDMYYTFSKPTLPQSTIALQKKFSGFEPLDQRLSLFSLFFYPVLSGKNPGLSLLGLHFVGQVIPIWLIMLVESYRIGNSWKLISFSAVWFFLVENIASMLFTPLWCLLHLLTSPSLSSSATVTARRNSLLAHPVELWAIPWSVLIASGVPVTLLSTLPMAPQSPRWFSAQFWISVRQFHPFLTSIAHMVLSMLSRSSNVTYGSPSKRNRQVLLSLRSVHQVAMYIAIFSHVSIMCLVLTAQFQLTTLSSLYNEAFLPETVWKPFLFWQGVPKIDSFTTEATKFLQWDELITVFAFLIWALTLHRDGLLAVGKGPSWTFSVLKALMFTVIGSPAAAGIYLLRERDELYLKDEKTVDEKKDG